MTSTYNPQHPADDASCSHCPMATMTAINTSYRGRRHGQPSASSMRMGRMAQTQASTVVDTSETAAVGNSNGTGQKLCARDAKHDIDTADGRADTGTCQTFETAWLRLQKQQGHQYSRNTARPRNLFKQGGATRQISEDVQVCMALQTMQIQLEMYRNSSVYAQQTRNRQTYLLRVKDRT